MESLSSHKKGVALIILGQIESAILRLQERTEKIESVDDFLMSPGGMEKLDAACMLLIAIGESLKNLDKVTDKKLLSTYPSIPWSDVIGIRDVIAHHYFHIDADAIFQVVHYELGALLKAIHFFVSLLKS